MMMLGKVNKRVRVGVVKSVVNCMLVEIDWLCIVLFIVGMIKLVMSLMIRMILNLSMLVMIWQLFSFYSISFLMKILWLELV